MMRYHQLLQSAERDLSYRYPHNSILAHDGHQHGFINMRQLSTIGCVVAGQSYQRVGDAFWFEREHPKTAVSIPF